MAENNSEILNSIPIASFSFEVGNIEEVGFFKIWTKIPVNLDKPDSYSVTWSEWAKNDAGERIEAKTEPQIQKTRKIQKFFVLKEAATFFLEKVNNYLMLLDKKQ